MKIKIVPGLCAALLFAAIHSTAQADSATWTGDSPFYSDWFNSENWNPETVPENPGDVATFATADQSYIYVYTEDVGPVAIDSMVFMAGAIAFNFQIDGVPSFTLSGAGIVNDSGLIQTFTIPPVGYHETGYGYTFVFAGNARAGDLTQITAQPVDAGEAFAGVLEFDDASSAGAAVITNMGGKVANGITLFYGTSTADGATITNTPGKYYDGGGCGFNESSSAGNATIINEGALNAVTGGGGGVAFFDSSSAGTSTITCNAGVQGGSYYPAEVVFEADSTGDLARIILFGDGRLSVGSHEPSGVTIGSLEGDGNVVLTTTSYDPPLITLQIGGTNSSTTFSGVIQDATGRPGGSLAKVGTGILTLTGANTYAGTTTVMDGELRVNNKSGSGTGTGSVYVKGGTMSGAGIVAGPVQVGLAKGRPATLAPGSDNAATLTLQSQLIFDAKATYSCTVQRKKQKSASDEVIANGVTIASGAHFKLVAKVNGQLTVGTTFTVISNTASGAISGTFANLADGAVITADHTNFQASYEGGDGNDLTLTVVP